MPVMERVSLASRMLRGFERAFRSPIVRVGALALGLGSLGMACNRDKVMELPDSVSSGSWTAVAENFARIDLKIAQPSELLKADLANCFSAANSGKKPSEAIVGESGRETIFPPDAGCIGRAVWTAQAGIAAPATEAPAAASALKPALLEPLPPLSMPVETLLRKGAVTPISITLPEGFTVDPAALGTIYVPMEQGVDIALVRVDANTAPVLTERTLIGYGLKPGDKFKWNAGLPLSVSFQLLGTRVQAGTEDICGATANGNPLVLALNVNAFEVVENRGGGRRGSGSGTVTEPPPSLTPPPSIRETIMSVGSNGNQ
jgi:hypothetical protein